MRLGKRERAERKGQWLLVKSAKSALVQSNLASLPEIRASTHAATATTGGRKFSTGMRLSPDPKQGYTFHGASNMRRPDNLGRDKGFAKPV